MESTVESTKIKTRHSGIEERQSYTTEEIFNPIDKKFINFYGEYGRKIVNARRFGRNKKSLKDLKGKISFRTDYDYKLMRN
jgi:hypothetical protein